MQSCLRLDSDQTLHVILELLANHDWNADLGKNLIN